MRALLAAFVLATPAHTVGVHESRYGPILFDGRGFVLYAFTKDAQGRSACSDACAAVWPPYLASRPVAGKLLGTVRRSDGKL